MLNFQIIKSIFDGLYSPIDGYKISVEAREKLSYADKAHTYGEVTVEGFYRLFADFYLPKTGVFYDLGSGTGKAVILAALLGDFSTLVGVEILPELSQASRAILDQFRDLVQKIPSLTKKKFSIDFVNADFLQFDFSDADVVFANSTCFYDELVAHLERKFVRLKKGAKVVMVTRTLQLPFFKLLKTGQLPFSWRAATINYYEKLV